MKLNLSQKIVIQIVVVCFAIIAISLFSNMLIVQKRGLEVGVELSERNAKRLKNDWDETFHSLYFYGDKIAENLTTIISDGSITKQNLFDYFEFLLEDDVEYKAAFAFYKDDVHDFSSYFYASGNEVMRSKLSEEQESKFLSLVEQEGATIVPLGLFAHDGNETELNSVVFPIKNNDEIKGVFGLNFPVDYFDQMLNKLNDKEDGIKIYLVCSQGMVLSNSAGIENGVHYSETDIQERWLSEAFNNTMKSDGSHLVMNVPLQFSMAGSQGYFVMTALKGAMINDSNDIQLVNFIIMLFGIVFLSFFIYRTVHRNLDPIDEVLNVMRCAEDGDLNKRTTIKSSDEIEKIGEGLNSLLDSLSESRNELLREVEDNKELNIELEELIQANDRMYFDTIKSLNIALETKDTYTAGHCDRVTEYALMIAEKLNMTEKEKNTVFYGATIHDIGKIGIPGSVLNKNGRLDEDEYNKIKSHPEKGYHILKDIYFLRDSLNIVYQHHERFDGRGYPQGLKGKEIDFFARIVAIADTFDAMTSDRAYRKALPYEIAVEELIKNRGTQFDPELVDIFVEELKEKRDKN